MTDPWSPAGKVRCPFHHDRSPSAILYADGSFHCFVCRAHAENRVDLARKMYFPHEPYERGMLLARAIFRKGGYTIPALGVVPAPKPGPNPDAVFAMTTFTDLASRHLAGRPDILEHLRRSRGLHDPLRLHLGAADAVLVGLTRTRMREEGIENIEKVLAEAGLITQDEGKYRLRQRIIIPEVRNSETIFYQARATDASEIKYLNPCLPKPVFGLESLAYASDLVIIGEGPFDILPFIEVGTSSLALLGTGGGESEDLLASLTGRTVIVGLDRDPVGLQRGGELSRGLQELGITAYHYPPREPFKDYGEWVAHDGVKEVLAWIQWS